MEQHNHNLCKNLKTCEFIAKRAQVDLEYTQGQAKIGDPLAIQFLDEYKAKSELANTELKLARLYAQPVDCSKYKQ